MTACSVLLASLRKRIWTSKDIGVGQNSQVGPEAGYDFGVRNKVGKRKLGFCAALNMVKGKTFF